MCSLDHSRVAVPDCKRGIAITWLTSLSQPHQIPLGSICKPTRGHEVKEGKLERRELMVGAWGSAEMMVLEWKVLRSESSRRERESRRNAI